VLNFQSKMTLKTSKNVIKISDVIVTSACYLFFLELTGLSSTTFM